MRCVRNPMADNKEDGAGTIFFKAVKDLLGYDGIRTIIERQDNRVGFVAPKATHKETLLHGRFDLPLKHAFPRLCPDTRDLPEDSVLLPDTTDTYAHFPALITRPWASHWQTLRCLFLKRNLPRPTDRRGKRTSRKGILKS